MLYSDLPKGVGRASFELKGTRLSQKLADPVNQSLRNEHPTKREQGNHPESRYDGFDVIPCRQSGDEGVVPGTPNWFPPSSRSPCFRESRSGFAMSLLRYCRAAAFPCW